MANENIRTAAKSAKVYLWQIADVIGITDNEFSRHLRKELPKKEQETILTIIEKLKGEKESENEQ